MTNWRLWLGIILSSFLLFIAIFGAKIAPYEKDYIEPSGYYYNSDEDFGFNAAPFPPSKKHLLGTDQWGYDILTLLLHGAKYTILVGVMVALIRLIIGAFFGMIAGIRNRQKLIGNSLSLLGSIPAFVIIYFVMVGIVVNSTLSTMELVLIQAVLMIIIGIPGVYAAIQSKTSEICNNLYITAAKSLGAGPLRIARKHVFPHLRGTIMIMFIKEIIFVLSLIGQLGIFNVFLGGTILRLGGSDIYLSITSDWAGLIGQWRSFIYGYQWILYYPLIAFVLVIFSFYMLSRGLELQQKSSLQKFPHI